MNQEYDLAEMRKVVIPTHLDDFLNVMCVLCATTFNTKMDLYVYCFG